MIVCRRLQRTISNCVESYETWTKYKTLIFYRRLCSSNVPLEDQLVDDKFTNAERERILSILNSSNAEKLARFNITQGRLKSLIAWKNKKGPFTTLSELLEVDGLGINLLNKFCQSILTETTTNCTPVRPLNRQKRDTLMPTLNKTDINNISSAVGIHIESTGISWAKLEKANNELVNWNYCDFSTVPKKTTAMDTFTLAVKIIKSLPPADIYVFANRSNSPSNNNSAKMMPYSLQSELSSMLLALINTSEIHNPCSANKFTEGYSNKVYYLRSNIPARLFGALVGTERVSTEATIFNLINGDANSLLPCSKVIVGPSLIADYNKCVKGYKDLLEQSLLLVITFMDLYISNNPACQKAIRIRK